MSKSSINRQNKLPSINIFSLSSEDKQPIWIRLLIFFNRLSQKKITSKEDFMFLNRFFFKVARKSSFCINKFIEYYGMHLLKKNNQAKLVLQVFNHKIFARATNSQFSSAYLEENKYFYEIDVSWAISNYVDNKSVIYDIGSNWGHHSFNSILLFGNKAYCFEPNPIVFDDLVSISNQLGINETNINCFNVALGNRKEQIELLQPTFASGVASTAKKYHKNRNIGFSNNLIDKIMRKLFFNTPIKYVSRCYKLDDFIKTNNLDLPDFIKIDAEGSEINILYGGIDIIKSCKPYICFEYWSNKKNGFKPFKEYFDNLGYDVLYLNKEKINKTLFDKNIKYSPEKFKINNIETHKTYNLLACPKL